MSQVLVVGSVAYDTVETPQGSRQDMLGGSAVYFALAARVFARVAVSGVVGEDFRREDLDLLASAGVDIECLRMNKGCRTFRWHGRYHENMNRRDTVSVQLNVLEGFRPVLPERYRACPFVFLANGPTATQSSLLEQVGACRPVVFFDTMDLWIETEREGVLDLLRRTGGIILNDGEALLLSGETNVVKAGRALRARGPADVVIKKGEHGVLAFLRDGAEISLPAFPLAEVVDPTGAGDSFAGAFMGSLAAGGGTSEAAFRKALAVASVTASFCVESFGTERLAALDAAMVERRLAEYRAVTRSG